MSSENQKIFAAYYYVECNDYCQQRGIPLVGKCRFCNETGLRQYRGIAETTKQEVEHFSKILCSKHAKGFYVG